ncbi:uncharacterized protein LOC124923678 [Impatiens glandulifera]|uniref:uncharacterized protein LOC124923678 n=1 Tax=Impatiens glandulifera TaxID=253017 RepID=UPI001FB188B6|nr:uncharacterized protein LOC124923678 [Impatiens glandulifera]
MGEYKSEGTIQVGSCYGFRVNSNRHDQFVKKLGKNRNGSSSSKSWGLLGDPELQRKKRVASYKAYSVEGKVKGSIRNTFRWLKLKYTQVIYGC